MKKTTNKATNEMKKLLAEREAIHNGYNNALQTAQAEYNELEKEFFDAEANAKLTHKAFILGQATNEDYQKAKKQVKDTDEKLRDAGYKLDEINTYRKEDLMELLYKLESNLQAYGKEKTSSEEALRYKVLQAKYDYLKSIHELAEEHREIWQVTKDIEELKVELGLKQYNYVSYESVFINLFSNAHYGTQGMDITHRELRDVFLDGKIDNRFLKEIEKGKQLGLI